jgi:hypothetical protein
VRGALVDDVNAVLNEKRCFSCFYSRLGYESDVRGVNMIKALSRAV